VALTQALRARLRSACPSGTKAILPIEDSPCFFQPAQPGLIVF
jgi:hypothetical protein